LAPQLVDALHSHAPEEHVLAVEHDDAEEHIREKQLPEALSQRPAPHASAGLTRQSGVHTPRELSVVTDWHT